MTSRIDPDRANFTGANPGFSHFFDAPCTFAARRGFIGRERACISDACAFRDRTDWSGREEP